MYYCTSHDYSWRGLDFFFLYFVHVTGEIVVYGMLNNASNFTKIVFYLRNFNASFMFLFPGHFTRENVDISVSFSFFKNMREL